MRQRVLNPLGMTASVGANHLNEMRERVVAIGYAPLQSDRPFRSAGKLTEATVD